MDARAQAEAQPAQPLPPPHLCWVSDWRLRAALGNEVLWQDLLLQLRVVRGVAVRGVAVWG